MEEVERFTAEGEDGRRYTVVLWAKLTQFRDGAGNVSWHRGGTVYQLLDGSHVNRIEPGVFKIFETEERIRKVVD